MNAVGSRVGAALCAMLVFGVSALPGCKDDSRFTTRDDRFEGTVVTGSFVRTGIDSGVTLCLSLDTDHLQDAPGTITTSDGRFQGTPLRPIPQLWHDPLSTLNFGEGRLQNLIYMATPIGDDSTDVTVFVSLMQSDGIEVRLLRGAPGGTTPPAPVDAGVSATATPGAPIFGVFSLSKHEGTSCP